MSRFIITGDWHITDQRPENRIDNYADAMLEKVQFILGMANSRDAYAILQPGDFTNSPTINYEVFGKYAEIFNKSCCEIVTTYGQHDLLHRRMENTALSAFDKACDNIRLLKNDITVGNEDFEIYASAYGEDIPPIRAESRRKDKFNILITHRMVIHRKLWRGQTEFTTAKKLLSDNKGYHLIVTGDNHKTFIIQDKDRYLINCGSLMRSDISQKDHEPILVVFDTDTSEMEVVALPIDPNYTVFRDVETKPKKTLDERISAVVETLSEGKELDLQFEDEMIKVAKELVEAERLSPGGMDMIMKGMKSE